MINYLLLLLLSIYCIVLYGQMATIRKRKDKAGDIRYQVIVRKKGAPPQYATFERLTDARKWERQTESSIEEGRHFKTTEAKRHTVADLIDRYINDALPQKPKAYKRQKAQLEWWKARIGVYTLADATPSLISEQRDHLLKGVTRLGKLRSPATVNRYLAALSHVFTIAEKEWEWVQTNPIRKVRKQKESRGRVRFLDETERGALLVATKKSKNRHLYPIVVLALSTGMRLGEITGLKWGNVDLADGRIIIDETKNGERRAVPLVGFALQVMKDHTKVRRVDWDFIFSSDQKNQPVDIRKAWNNAIKQAGIEDFRFHDLRHSAASYLAMNGASLAEIADVLGHKTLQMVKRYSHISEQHTASVVEKMNLKIFGK